MLTPHYQLPRCRGCGEVRALDLAQLCHQCWEADTTEEQSAECALCAQPILNDRRI